MKDRLKREESVMSHEERGKGSPLNLVLGLRRRKMEREKVRGTEGQVLREAGGGVRFSRGLSFFFVFLFSLFIFSFSCVYASPEGGSVQAGQAAINQSGGTTTIQQLTNNVIINWNSFNIGLLRYCYILRHSARIAQH